MEFLDQWLTSMRPTQLYVALFLLMASNGLFSTPPSEITWGLAGFLASQGEASPAGLLLAGVAGNLFGTTLLYLLARKWGERCVAKVLSFNPFLREGLLCAIQEAFARHGPGIVFFGRCLPVVRSIVSIPAGLARMNLLAFLYMTAAGCALWALLWGAAGWSIGAEIRTLIEETRIYALALTALILTVIGVWLTQRTKRYLRLERGPQSLEQKHGKEGANPPANDRL